MAVISGCWILFSTSLPSNWRIKSQKVFQGSVSASGVLMASFLCILIFFRTKPSFLALLEVEGELQTKCAPQEKQHDLVELNLTGQSKGGRHRGFSWALLSWHHFHPKRGDHATTEPSYVQQQDFSKITLFKYFILIFFLSRGPKPLNKRQFCFPSCQQYFGYFKNVGQG